jgi:hypothetical protein
MLNGSDDCLAAHTLSCGLIVPPKELPTGWTEGTHRSYIRIPSQINPKVAATQAPITASIKVVPSSGPKYSGKGIPKTRVTAERRPISNLVVATLSSRVLTQRYIKGKAART